MATASIILPTLHAAQKKVVEEARRYNVLCIGRRAGKSTLGEDRIIRTTLEGWTTAWFSPEEKFVEEIWRDLLQALKPVILYKNESKRRIDVVGGGSLEMWNMSKPQNVARGRKYKRVVIDEAAQIPNLEMAWQQAIRSTLIDYEGDAFILSCVTAGTLIPTTAGIQPIEKFVTNRTPGNYTPLEGVYVAGFAGEPQRASDGYYSGTSATFRLTTKGGYVLECTPHHPLWAFVSQSEPGWVPAQHLQLGHHLAVRRGANLWGSDDDLRPYRHECPPPTGYTCRHTVPETMHPDLAYLMGAILGDGHVYFRTGKVTMASAVDEHDMHRFLSQGSSGCVFKQETQPLHWAYSSIDFTRFLAWYGFIPGARAPQKTIPERLWRASKETVCAFLSGLYDADGCAHSRNGIIDLCTSSRQLAFEVQQLLLNLGIICRWQEGAVKPTARVRSASYTYRLVCSGANAALFYELVGFRLQRKQCRKKFLPSLHIARSWRMDGLPHQQDRIRRIRKGAWFQGNVTKNLAGMETNASVGYVKAQEFLARTSGTTATEDWKALANLARDAYFWDPIVKIERGEAETFDLVVPTTQAFVANGIISHNTPRGFGFFHRMYMNGINADKRIAEAQAAGAPLPLEEWKSWQMPSMVNPHLPPTELPKMKEELTPKNYSQEVLAQFLGEGTSVFPNVEECATGQIQAWDPTHQYVAGVDWGRDADWTIYTVMDLTTRAVVWIEITGKIEFHHQRARLMALYDRYHPITILCEANSIGVPNFEELQREDLPVVQFWATNASKMEAVDALVLALSRRQITLLDKDQYVDHLPVGQLAIDELHAYASTRLPSGKIQYGAPEGSHDDMAVSLMLAWLCCLKPDLQAFNQEHVEQSLSDHESWQL